MASGIFFDEDADHAQAARWPHAFYQCVHGHVGDFIPRRVMAWIADTFAAAICAAVCEIEDFFDRIEFRIIHGNGSDFFRQGRAVGMPIHDNDFARSFDHRRIRGHESHRAASVNHNCFTRPKTGQFGCMPAHRVNIGKHYVVILLFLRVFGKL